MPKPRFSTLLLQAREQCNKQFDAFDMNFNGDMIVKFFASGMEYRLNHTHVEFEQTFSSVRDEASFILGYLQGKGADVDMIKKIQEECRNQSNNDLIRSDSQLANYFMAGISYEEFILEPDKLQPYHN